MRNFMRGNDDSGMESCPLMGASKAVAMIDGAAMLVIGTEECTGYTKSQLSMKGMGDNCFSLVLDNQDVTFGSSEKEEEAVEELMREYKPDSLYLITTCVIEVIGDDFTDIAQRAREKYGVPVNIISTNNYSGENDRDGMEKVFRASGDDAPMMGGMKGGWGMDKSKMREMMMGGGGMDSSRKMEMMKKMKAKRGGRI